MSGDVAPVVREHGRLRIVVAGGGVAKYPQGGGHWAWALQYLRGLTALGHEVLFLQFLPWSAEGAVARERADVFFRRLERCWPGGSAALVLLPQSGEQDLERAEIAGMSAHALRDFVRSADLLWNLAGGVQPRLRVLFRRTVLIDVDPGHLQFTPEVDALRAHDAFLTVGLNIGAPDCGVPKLGLEWRTFPPFVYLPDWPCATDDRAEAPFSSVTHWNWGGEIRAGARVISASKRDAYLRWIELPRLAGRSFELATPPAPGDGADWERLRAHGWSIVDAWQVADTPERYRAYIASSRAEISCPKPLARELRTGWLSDRSVAYLACGRPVLAEATGFEEFVACGVGLLAFETREEARAGVREIVGDYPRHSAAARELAAACFDSRLVLPRMLEASF